MTSTAQVVPLRHPPKLRFGDYVRIARRELGMDQRQFAELIAVKQATLGTWETGVRLASGGVIMARSRLTRMTRPWWRKKRFSIPAAVVVGIIILAVIFGKPPAKHTAKGSPAASPSAVSAPSTHTVGRYEQTSPIPYGKMTCGQFADTLTDHERFVFAHDVIVSLKAYNQSDTFARSFVVDVSNGCQPDPKLTVSEIAAGIATIATKDFPR